MPGIKGKNNFQDIQFLKGKFLISLPNCRTIKSSFVIFILKENDWSNKKKLKEAKTIVGKEPIFKNKSIKLKTIRMIGNWNDGGYYDWFFFFGFSVEHRIIQIKFVLRIHPLKIQ